MATCDEICKQLVAYSVCSPYMESSKLASHRQLSGETWETKRLTGLGKHVGACPYYAYHELRQTVQLFLRAHCISVLFCVVHKVQNFWRRCYSRRGVENDEWWLWDRAFEADVALLHRNIDQISTLTLSSLQTVSEVEVVSVYQQIVACLEAVIFWRHCA